MEEFYNKKKCDEKIENARISKILIEKKHLIKKKKKNINRFSRNAKIILEIIKVQ